MDNLDQRYRDALVVQQKFNRETWARLQEYGVNSSTELRIDFSYLASSKSKAVALEQALEQETDYKVAVKVGEDDNWIVEGLTQPTAVSLEILDEWVDWMITAGLHQDCNFDGWGAEVPSVD